jgi:CubicO group peptidase (beta-lactamase class C family)
MENIGEHIDHILIKAVKERVFPSFASGICRYKNGDDKKSLIISGGSINYSAVVNADKDIFYDLASLTKPLATALSIISLLGAEKIYPQSRIAEYMGLDLPEDKREITVYQLLNHSSGLPAHRPYYQQLANLPPQERKAELLRLIVAEPLVAQPGSVAIYSDLGYLLLGMLIERLAEVGLEQYFAEKIVGPLGLAEGIFFNPPGQLRKARESYQPVEDCPWRGRVLQGEVSDENCWVLGGVAGHAGLFGNIESVLGLTCAILEIWQGRRVHPYLRREELSFFLEAPSEVPGSTWALGFDHPSPGGSSSGKYLSPRSVGHLGFTGTSFWIDPDKELVIVLLTNRVHPSRENILIREFRPLFHDRVVELLGLS